MRVWLTHNTFKTVNSKLTARLHLHRQMLPHPPPKCLAWLIETSVIIAFHQGVRSTKLSMKVAKILHITSSRAGRMESRRSIDSLIFGTCMCIDDTYFYIYIYRYMYICIYIYVSQVVRITGKQRKRSREICLLRLGTCLCIGNDQIFRSKTMQFESLPG